jgi:hypothetical protein
MPAVSRVPIPIYLAELLVIHCPAADLWAHAATLPKPVRALLASDDGDADGWAEVIYATRQRASVRRYAVLYVNAAQSPEAKRLTIVHEAGHLAVRIFGHIEQAITKESDEPFAYLLEWITREAWAACGVK